MQLHAATHTEFVTCDNTIDETYTRLHGQWTYIYRAIDEHGQVVDAFFSTRRNAEAAKTFFERALAETGVAPVRVTTGCPLGEGEMLSACAARLLAARGTPHLQVFEQRHRAGPWSSQAAPVPDAWV